MGTEQDTNVTFSPADMEAFRPTMKVGMVATVNDEGLPHLTLLASLQASTPRQLVWGQFTEGLSKGFVRRNPRVGFLIMTMDKAYWRGKATFTHTARQGPEYDMYNETPMFRYNAYFGVHTVYYLDLVEQSGKQQLPMGRVIFAAVQTLAARYLSRARSKAEVLNPWTRALMNKLDNLKFLAYVDDDGYPAIVPLIQAQVADDRRTRYAEHVIFATSAFREDLEALPAGTPVAVFGMSLDMEDVLMRGTFEGVRRRAGIRCGSVRVNWVYNSMPPKPQQIYPEVELLGVRDFV